MGKGHDHHGQDHDHDHDHDEAVLEFSAKKPSKVKSFDSDALIHIDGTEGGSFAIASSKQELKQLMKSDAEVVYDQSTGKLFLNDNGTAKGWGKKKVGGLLAKFTGKPVLSAENFEGLSAHKGDAITGGGGSKDGGDIKDQIASLREGLSDAKVSELYGETLIDPKQGLKSIAKAGKKEGYKLDKKELGAALDAMNDAGAFGDVELDDAALASLMGMGGSQQQTSNNAS
jgi:hypothetical protein